MNSPGKFASFKATAAKVWALSTPYFRSEEKWKARGLLAAIVVLNLAAVYMLVLLNDWNRVFYDALQNKDQVVFWQQLGRFSYLAFAFIIIAVYKFYLTQLLEVRWRAWMTAQYLQRWLGHHAFYRMELARFEGRTASAQAAAEGYRTAFRATEARWRAGLASQLELEDARRTALAADQSLALLTHERAGAWVALYRAAGGGWQAPVAITTAQH